jgi:hypothetical protein
VRHAIVFFCRIFLSLIYCPHNSGATVQVGLAASKVVITKLKLDKDRKKILDRKNRSDADKAKKFAQSDVNMAGVD